MKETKKTWLVLTKEAVSFSCFLWQIQENQRRLDIFYWIAAQCSAIRHRSACVCASVRAPLWIGNEMGIIYGFVALKNRYISQVEEPQQPRWNKKKKKKKRRRKETKKEDIGPIGRRRLGHCDLRNIWQAINTSDLGPALVHLQSPH